jgi:hypothetical protein
VTLVVKVPMCTVWAPVEKVFRGQLWHGARKKEEGTHPSNSSAIRYVMYTHKDMEVQQNFTFHILRSDVLHEDTEVITEESPGDSKLSSTGDYKWLAESDEDRSFGGSGEELDV